MYKLSPSDFAFLYEECKHCYYLKVKHGITQPSMPMPGIFSAINTRLQGLLIDKPLTDLSPDFPAGIVESQEGFVESKSVNGLDIYIKGKYDLLVKQPDGTYMIVDFKLSQPHPDKISKYQSQLWAYKYAFENPKVGAAKTITKMGLIVMYPDRTKFANGEAFLSFPPKWLEVAYDDTQFKRFMQGVNELLVGPMPPESTTCKWCIYRHIGEPAEAVDQLAPDPAAL